MTPEEVPHPLEGLVVVDRVGPLQDQVGVRGEFGDFPGDGPGMELIVAGQHQERRGGGPDEVPVDAEHEVAPEH